MSKSDIRWWAVALLIMAPWVALCAWLWTLVYHAPLWYIIPAAIAIYLCMVALPVVYVVLQHHERERRRRHDA